MGGLWRVMPQTGVVFIVGTSRSRESGRSPDSSRRGDLAACEAGRPGHLPHLALTAFSHAFYMFRVVFLTFLATPTRTATRTA